jgi:hypothetical protein
MITTTDIIVDGAIVATIEAGKLKYIVDMLDEPVHTVANGYRCTDHTCPCYVEAQEQRNTAALNGGGRPFSLLR